MDNNKSLATLVGAAVGFGAARLADWALVAGSLATALGAVGLAGYMTLAGGGKPHINGMQYLAIFAQPSHPAHPAEGQSGVDMNPVGAIPPDAQTKVNGYALVGAKASYGWLREGDHIFAVRPGDDVPRLGHVASIEQRDGRWALVDGKGAPLIISAVVALAPDDGGRFEKRMIFGEGK